MTETGPLFVSSGDLVSDRRYKAAVELAARGDFAAAADVLTQTVEAAPDFATAWFALGAIRDRLGDRDGAVAAFRAASRADPDDYHGARLQLLRLGASTGTPAMTEPYVRRLFDQYAGRYDAALTEHLHYRGPALLRDAVASALERMGRPMHFASLLDLGCGTGLAGQVFRPFAGRLLGVDLSAAMIARAEAKGDYDRLVVGNLVAFLSDEIAKDGKYDLVLAADVFVYVNELAPIFVDIARVLAPRGVVAFTVETHSGAGVALLPTLRFAHGEAYLRDAIASAGLKLLALDRAAIRSEKGTPVAGLVVVAISAGT
ncbi:MAG: methyltransferase domain-containing protein [Betaproteobacteria bacterium]